MAAKSAYSGSWSCRRLRAAWKPKSSSKNSFWNPTVGETGVGPRAALPPATPQGQAPTAQHCLTVGSVFYCVAKRPAEEVLRLQAERRVECDVTDFYSGSLEEGDLVLHGQGPAGAGAGQHGLRPALLRGDGSLHWDCETQGLPLGQAEGWAGFLGDLVWWQWD